MSKTPKKKTDTNNDDPFHLPDDASSKLRKTAEMNLILSGSNVNADATHTVSRNHHNPLQLHDFIQSLSFLLGHPRIRIKILTYAK